ncbi:MAG TPA: GntR family transcriptional regulator [Alphaproteobacteria bacterium]
MDAIPDFKPLYLQVKDLLMQRLVTGAWRPGEALPSEFGLAAEFKVSQGTVRKALDELAAQNLLVRQQGKGTFVAQHTPQRALFHFFHLVSDDGGRALPGSRVLSLTAAKGKPGETRRLGLKAGAKVIRLKRVRPLGGEPAIFERIVLPAARFPNFVQRLPADIPNEVYRYYEDAYGVTVARAVEKLKAVSATAEEARAIGLAKDAPLLEIDRIAYAIDGSAVEWRLSRCSTARHHYLSEIV